MSDQFRRLRIFLHALFHAASFLATIAALLGTSVGAAAIAFTVQEKSWVLPIAAYAAGVATTLTIVVVAYVRTATPGWLLGGYRWISADYHFRLYEDTRKQSQDITIVLEATRHGVNHFENRYRWSGRGKDDIKVLSDGHSLMGPPVVRGSWKYYYIYLGGELGLGERAEVRISQDLYDDADTFEPYVSKVIREPVERVILRVQFPLTSLPRKVERRWERGEVPSNDLVNPPEVVPCDRLTGEARYEISRPALRNRYELRWWY